MEDHMNKYFSVLLHIGLIIYFSLKNKLAIFGTSNYFNLCCAFLSSLSVSL